jgi:hypothetical protein
MIRHPLLEGYGPVGVYGGHGSSLIPVPNLHKCYILPGVLPEAPGRARSTCHPCTSGMDWTPAMRICRTGYRKFHYHMMTWTPNWIVQSFKHAICCGSMWVNHRPFLPVSMAISVSDPFHRGTELQSCTAAAWNSWQPSQHHRPRA